MFDLVTKLCFAKVEDNRCETTRSYRFGNSATLRPLRGLGAWQLAVAKLNTIVSSRIGRGLAKIKMPRRQQPGTPPGLPPIPAGAYKKSYYPAPDTVYYLKTSEAHHLLK